MGIAVARAEGVGVVALDGEARAGPLADALEALARSYDAERSGRGFEHVDRAVSALMRNASPRIVVDWLALRI